MPVMEYLLHVFIAITVASSLFCESSIARKTANLEQKIEELVDNLGVTQFQVAELMQHKYAHKVSLLRDTLAENMVNSYENTPTRNPYDDCCDPNGNFPHWDEQLGLYVDYDRICVVGTGLENDPEEFVPVSVVNDWKRMFEEEHNKGVQWIYYGSEQGVMYNYPAVKQCDSSYDPRYRPFYIETVTPIPKDIVIVIDRSGSMGEEVNGHTLMDIAIDAAITVINTLSINDRVGIVTFADDAETPPGTDATSDCYRHQMARATFENKKYLKRYLLQVSHIGNQFTRYRKGLKAAFDLFKNTPPIEYDVRERSKVILFLTDGRPTDCQSAIWESGWQECENIYEDISEMNGALNNSVIILTYGLGESIDSDVETILENMAQQIRSNGEVTVGSFTAVRNPVDLRSKMASYYHMFVRADDDRLVHFTVPYQDAFGSGIIVSACVPVKVGTILKGVICLDEPVIELLSELSPISLQQTSYSFMVDIYSRVLSHPNAHTESEITNHPKFTFLSSLEIDNNGGETINQMITSIVNEESGSVTANTKRIITRGDVNLDGVSSSSVNTNYYWKKVPDTKYVIGVAISQGDQNLTIKWPADPPQNFVYHKLSTQEAAGDSQICSHYSLASSKDTMVTQFSGKAFNDPYQFLFTNDDQTNVDKYEEYFTRNDAVNPGFQAGVRDFVSATAEFQNILKQRDGDDRYNHLVMWRYLATENGIFRIYPATELPKSYDATERQWYKQAKANRGSLALTRPYLSPSGDSAMITLARVMFEGRQDSEERNGNDRAIGVMGMDISPFYFYKIISESVSDCQNHSCFLVDRSGFIVFHDDWMDQSTPLQDMINVHITEKEPTIAKRLIEELYGMRYTTCVNIFDVRNQYTWRLSGQNLEDHSTSEFAIHAVADTNLLLVVRKRTMDTSPASCFACNYEGFYKCINTVEPGACFCPCYTQDNTGYLFCEDLFNFVGDGDPICSPPLPYVNFSSVPPIPSNSDVHTCYDFNCSMITTERDCMAYPACNWCIHQEAPRDVCGQHITPSCNARFHCAADQIVYNPVNCPSTPPTTIVSNIVGSNSSEEESEGVPGWAIALIVLGVLLILILITCMLFGWFYVIPYLRKRDDGLRNELDHYDILPDNVKPSIGHLKINLAQNPNQPIPNQNHAYTLERQPVTITDNTPRGIRSQRNSPQRQTSSSSSTQEILPPRPKVLCPGLEPVWIIQSPDVLAPALGGHGNSLDIPSEYIGQRGSDITISSEYITQEQATTTSVV